MGYHEEVTGVPVPVPPADALLADRNVMKSNPDQKLLTYLSLESLKVIEKLAVEVEYAPLDGGALERVVPIFNVCRQVRVVGKIFESERGHRMQPVIVGRR